MMRWRPWPAMQSRKFVVRVMVRRIEGMRSAGIGVMAAELRWKGPRAALRKRKTQRNCTREAEGDGLGSVEWNQEFECVCCFTCFSKDSNKFHPWEIQIRLLKNGLKQGSRNKASVIGMASLNLADFAATSKEDLEIDLPLLLPGVNAESHPSLNLALSLVELRSAQESPDRVPRSIVAATLSPSSGDTLPSEKENISALKAGLRKVKVLTEFVSSRKSKKTSREDEGSSRCSGRSEDADYPYPFDTDSLDDDLDDEEQENGKEDYGTKKSFSYGTLATANYVGGSLYSDMTINGEYEDWVYYSHCRSDVGCSRAGEMPPSVHGQALLQRSKRSILPWRKRKLSFGSPKAKGEPLLKKGNGEGGDDIDFDRRQLSSSDESSFSERNKVDDAFMNGSYLSDFGDDNFAIGSWELKEVVSRDGQMKLSSQVFFASIDQRSERAAGESACTALVAVIADWFQSNHDTMPIKSQFDSLIREGSLEWRNLCENQMYRERFPDKHFDLDTVLQSKIRPLSVVPDRSFIGFFHPEGVENNNGFDFLHGAMSFDNIWDEIGRACSEPHLYILSWNDHFFVLKVEKDAYYIIDTLGERLFEGCDQAYILKFDDNTVIHRMPQVSSNEAKQNVSSRGSPRVEQEQCGNIGVSDSGEELVCKGKESCKEYIKHFLAAIPIRELQADFKKGLMASTPLHHRLQIEFHCTEPIASVVSHQEEFVQKEEQRTETELMLEIMFSQQQLQAAKEAAFAICHEFNSSNDEFFVRQEESVVPAFSLMQEVEVV